MTNEEFRDAQTTLGFTNKQMAAALGVGLNTVEQMRMGTRPISKRTWLLVMLFTDEISVMSYLRGVARNVPRRRNRNAD